MAALSGSLPVGPRGRALALLVTAGGVLIVWLGVVSPLIDLYNANAEALAQRRALAGRMQDLADALPDLRRQVEASQPKDAPVAALLEGGSDAVAAATLQGLLETMCAGAGAKVTSAEALPAETGRGVSPHRPAGQPRCRLDPTHAPVAGSAEGDAADVRRRSAAACAADQREGARTAARYHPYAARVPSAGRGARRAAGADARRRDGGPSAARCAGDRVPANGRGNEHRAGRAAGAAPVSDRLAPDGLTPKQPRPSRPRPSRPHPSRPPPEQATPDGAPPATATPALAPPSERP